MSQCCVLFLDGSLSQANVSKQTKIEPKSASTNFKTDGPSFSSSILLLSVRVGFQTVSGKTTAIFKRKGHLCLSESLECIQVTSLPEPNEKRNEPDSKSFLKVGGIF